MNTLLRYLELILTIVGVIVVLAVFALFRGTSPWRPAAICAIAVGILHGIIFYSVRSQQRKARSQQVFSIRDMLDDMMSNRLASPLYPAQENEDWRARAQRAVWEIQARLNFIEAEGLRNRQPTPLDGLADEAHAPLPSSHIGSRIE